MMLSRTGGTTECISLSPSKKYGAQRFQILRMATPRRVALHWRKTPRCRIVPNSATLQASWLPNEDGAEQNYLLGINLSPSSKQRAPHASVD